MAKATESKSITLRIDLDSLEAIDRLRKIDNMSRPDYIRASFLRKAYAIFESRRIQYDDLKAKSDLMLQAVTNGTWKDIAAGDTDLYPQAKEVWYAEAKAAVGRCKEMADLLEKIKADIDILDRANQNT